jgi:hypothetical protein
MAWMPAYIAVSNLLSMILMDRSHTGFRSARYKYFVFELLAFLNTESTYSQGTGNKRAGVNMFIEEKYMKIYILVAII